MEECAVFSDRQGGSRLRRWAEQILLGIGCDPKWIEDFILAICEAYNNEWEHGKSLEVSVRLALVDGGRRLNITLGSEGSKIQENRINLIEGILMASGYLAPNGKGRGMGWHLITMLVRPEVVLVTSGALTITVVPSRDGSAGIQPVNAMIVMAPEDGRFHVVPPCDS